MADREYSSTDAAHGLKGFSDNSKWDQVQEGGLWSHNPVHLGPKDGFHDPIAAGPDRQQLQDSGDGNGRPDDALSKNGGF